MILAQDRIQSPLDRNLDHESSSSLLSIGSFVLISRYSVATARVSGLLLRGIPGITYVDVIFAPNSLRCVGLPNLLSDKHPFRRKDRWLWCWMDRGG